MKATKNYLSCEYATPHVHMCLLSQTDSFAYDDPQLATPSPLMLHASMHQGRTAIKIPELIISTLCVPQSMWLCGIFLSLIFRPRSLPAILGEMY